MGGKSIEREVSFNSGRTVCDHLDSHQYDVIPIYQTMAGTLYILPWHFLHRGKTSDFEKRLEKEAEKIIWDDLKSRINFMYIAMHGRYAEDGILQGTLELLGIPYLGSSRLASALCMDKIRVKRMLAYHGINVPRDIVLDPHEINSITNQQLIDRLANAKLAAPWVIKPYQEGSSLGISVVNDPKKLLNAIKKASRVHPTKQQTVLIEEYIAGMEFSCITLYDYKKQKYMPLLPTEIVPEEGTALFDYEQKYMPGRATKFTPPRCAQEIISTIQQTCGTVMEQLDIKTIARIDGFVTPDNRVIIVDPNTSSGMAPSSFLFREAAAMTNMNHTELINHLIETDLVRYGMIDRKKTNNKKNDATAPKLRVAVLLGGPSREREISLESGRNIIYKLSPHRYTVIPIFVDQQTNLYRISTAQLVLNSTKEIDKQINPEQQISWHSLKENYDFVFIALHGGVGENGCVQGMLEMLGVPYNGSSVLASALCMDKYKTTQYLKAAGFETPGNLLIKQKEWANNKETIIQKICATIPAPRIAKPNDDGCSILVQKISKESDLANAIDAIFAQGKSTALIEEYITGMELTVGVIGNYRPQALPPSQAIANTGILSIEEKFLPGAGENQTPAPLPESVLEMVTATMERAYKELGCKGYARIDCFYQSAQESQTKKERVVIIEINTLPGMTPATCIFHQAAEIGMKPMEFIDRIIEYGLEEHSTQQKNSDTLSIKRQKPVSTAQSL
jgi:D-alanine-D-alanine ligase